MNYSLRLAYTDYVKQLRHTKEYYVYVTAFDRMKQYSIEKQSRTLAGQQKCKWKYDKQVLFIPYHPDVAIRKEYDALRYKDIAVWNFQIIASEKLKKQIFTVLNYIIENYKKTVSRRYKLSGLQFLYDYCVEQGIEDIECMEQVQEEEWHASLLERGLKGAAELATFATLNVAREVLFLQPGEIHWHANIWYLERFHLSQERMNPSKKPSQISFMEVEQLTNRKLLKEYMKYQIGIGELSIATLLGKFREIKSFLVNMDKNDEDALQYTTEDFDKYFKELAEEKISAATFNHKISAVTAFYQFLFVKGRVSKIPFYPEYYYQKQVSSHHDRSVEWDISLDIIKSLKDCPEHIRVMYLHMWCLGLRISEICTLKGNAYYLQNKDAWMQIYQIKMKTYKRIPIPMALYKVMQVYIKIHEIGAEEYIFKNRKGGAFSEVTLTKQMKKYFDGISNTDYAFESHGYRHTIATFLYDCDVSIQCIRDYLGHNFEEMTEQYIDYMPKRIDSANDALFRKPENNLTKFLRKGEADGK